MKRLISESTTLLMLYPELIIFYKGENKLSIGSFLASSAEVVRSGSPAQILYVESLVCPGSDSEGWPHGMIPGLDAVSATALYPGWQYSIGQQSLPECAVLG